MWSYLVRAEPSNKGIKGEDGKKLKVGTLQGLDKPKRAEWVQKNVDVAVTKPVTTGVTTMGKVNEAGGFKQHLWKT